MPHGHGGFHGGGRFHGRGWGGYGWGPGWDYYDYGYPCHFYDAAGRCIEVPIMDAHALAVSGYHRGHVYQNTLMEIAPILTAPSAIPTHIEVHLDGHSLTVACELDGKIYRGTIDLSQAFDIARHYLRAYHEKLHNEPHLLVGCMSSGDVASIVADDTVRCGVEYLVGEMVEEHRRPYALLCAGFWGDLERGFKHAVSDVGHAITSTVKALGPVISVAAGVAATALVGPAGAPLASSLAGSLVNAVTGSGDTKQAAQQVVQQATQMAQSNPQVASALSAAQQAAAQTTAGYHAATTFASAAAGNQNAMQQVAQLTNAAAGGDSSAQAALNVAQQAASQIPNIPADLSNVMDSALGDATSAISSAVSSGDTEVAGAIGVLALLAAGITAGYYAPTVYHWGQEKFAEHRARVDAAAQVQAAH